MFLGDGFLRHTLMFSTYVLSDGEIPSSNLMLMPLLPLRIQRVNPAQNQLLCDILNLINNTPI